MNIKSYDDYTKFIKTLIGELTKEEGCFFSAICAEYFYRKYQTWVKEDLKDSELKIVTDLLDETWKALNSVDPDISKLKKIEFDCISVGMLEGDDPRDLFPETIDCLSSIELASSCLTKYDSNWVLNSANLITDGIDRELDEKYPDYLDNSLEIMFTYQEMKDALEKIVKLINVIKNGKSSRDLHKALE